jgi:hypothetical protein
MSDEACLWRGVMLEVLQCGNAVLRWGSYLEKDESFICGSFIKNHNIPLYKEQFLWYTDGSKVNTFNEKSYTVVVRCAITLGVCRFILYR